MDTISAEIFKEQEKPYDLAKKTFFNVTMH